MNKNWAIVGAILAITALTTGSILASNPNAEAEKPAGKGKNTNFTEIRQFTLTSDSADTTVIDTDVTKNSVVIISLDEVNAFTPYSVCGVASLETGSFVVSCARDLIETGTVVNYIVANNP